jgi:hypothetical protein
LTTSETLLRFLIWIDLDRRRLGRRGSAIEGEDERFANALYTQRLDRGSVPFKNGQNNVGRRRDSCVSNEAKCAVRVRVSAQIVRVNQLDGCTKHDQERTKAPEKEPTQLPLGRLGAELEHGIQERIIAENPKITRA